MLIILSFAGGSFRSMLSCRDEQSYMGWAERGQQLPGARISFRSKSGGEGSLRCEPQKRFFSESQKKAFFWEASPEVSQPLVSIPRCLSLISFGSGLK